MQGGSGGRASGSSGTNTGGGGGTLTFRGGGGATGLPGGPGGSVSFRGGNAGSTNANGGVISFQTGVGSGTGTTGAIGFNIGITTVATFLSDKSGLQFPDDIATIFGTSQDVKTYFDGSAWIFDPQALTPGIQMKVLGDLNVTENVITEERYFLGNNASIGFNATCDFIFYDTSGGILSTLGC